MKVKKPKSKRVPVRLRHKIEKASAAKQRKEKKLAKKDPTWRSKIKKDPGVPNLFPFKDKILKEIEDGRRRKEEDIIRRRELARAQREGKAVEPINQNGMAMVDEDNEELLDLGEDEDEAMVEDSNDNPMAALLASARSRAAKFDPENASEADDMEEEDESDDSFTSFAEDSGPSKPKDTSKKAYAQAVNNLISSSDILLYVLDARDPQSTRSTAIEQQITSHPDKRLLLILNKIDLVPADVLQSWITHLRRSFPTLPLRCASSTTTAKTFDHKHLTPQFTANNVIKALKAASSVRGAGSTTVGILGYPNVGKSSVVNALSSRLAGRAHGASAKHRRECPVGAEAGVTTALREVKLDGKLKLVDSPGVVFATQDTGSSKDEHARLVLLNALPPRDIADPMPAVTLLLRRLGANEELMRRLLKTYELPALMSGEGVTGGRDITTDFLVQVARKRGRLGKGGVPNLHAAAQTVVADWRDGRIHGWVEAPAEKADTATRTAGDTKVIVKEWAKEFKLDGLWGVEDETPAEDEAMDIA